MQVPVRPEAVELSHQGAGWASHSEEALEQAEVFIVFTVLMLLVAKLLEPNWSHCGD